MSGRIVYMQKYTAQYNMGEEKNETRSIIKMQWKLREYIYIIQLAYQN